ncbi:MAG: YihY family inner membrane protein [Burkholderiaceae bacterium]|nr:YihY family inner membrane protein [Burkholderiaceae bacterium]
MTQREARKEDGEGTAASPGDARRGGADSSRSAPYRLARLARAMWRQASRLHLPQTAGSLAFLSLLAIAPMFSIVFWITTASPMFGRLRDALQGFLLVNLFPPSISDTVIELLNQFAAKANELSVLGLAVFLLTAFVALHTIEGTLNRIWLADRGRRLAHRLALHWMMLTLGPLLLGASLVFHGIVATSWLRGADFSEVRTAWFFVLPWATSVAGLTLLYRLLPSASVRWRDALLGAALAASLFEFLRTALGLYVTSLPTYKIVYGTFAALPLFLLWLFLGWMAVLLGALLAANLRFWASPGEPHLERTPQARFDDARSVLDAMCERLGADSHAAMPVDDIAHALGHDAERTVEAALLLTRLGYLTRFVQLGDPQAASVPAPDRVRDGVGRRLRWGRRAAAAADTVWAERWAWADDPRSMSLRALFEEIWSGGRAGGATSAGGFPEGIDRPLAGSTPAWSAPAG